MNHLVKNRIAPFLALGAISLLSLCFITSVDSIVAEIIAHVSDQFLWIAYARFPSLLVSLTILLWIDHGALNFDRRKVRWKAVVLASLCWLIPAAIGIFGLKVWVPRIEGWIDVTAFMITGLFAEEFLFRGSLYALSFKAFGPKAILKM